MLSLKKLTFLTKGLTRPLIAPFSKDSWKDRDAAA